MPNIRDLRPELSHELADRVALLTAATPTERPADAAAASLLLQAVLGLERDLESLLLEALPTIDWSRGFAPVRTITSCGSCPAIDVSECFLNQLRMPFANAFCCCIQSAARRPRRNPPQRAGDCYSSRSGRTTTHRPGPKLTFDANRNDRMMDPHSESLAAARRMDARCDELALATGKAPQIEAFLTDLAESERAALLLELLGLEIDFRVARGEQPNVSEYAARFPELPTEQIAVIVDATRVSCRRSIPERRSPNDALATR